MANEKDEINIYIDKDYVSGTYSLHIAQEEAVVIRGRDVKFRCFNAIEEHGVDVEITAFSPNPTKTPNVGPDYFEDWEDDRKETVGPRRGSSGPKRDDLKLKTKKATETPKNKVYFYYGVRAYHSESKKFLDEIDPKLRIDN